MTKMHVRGDMLTVNYISKGIRTIHIETELGIFNIILRLTDSKGRRVEKVFPLGNHYAGCKEVKATKAAALIEMKTK